MVFAVKLNDLTLAYDRHPAVHHLNGEFATGAKVAIAGPNGAGKSTLLKAIAGIMPIHEGSIEFNGISQKDIAFLPQAAEIQRDFPINILQMVVTGFWKETKGFGNISPLQKEKASKALDALGLQGFGARALDSLSSGQFQRALFARVMVQDAKLILLDEPFTAIDNNTTNALLKIIEKWHKEGKTIICILHDFEQIKRHFPECLLLAREAVAWGRSSEVLEPKNIVGTQYFHEAYPEHSEVCEA